MTIKEVEILTGITKANIRFYEKEGLLAPGRSSNNYREYSEDDVVITISPFPALLLGAAAAGKARWQVPDLNRILPDSGKPFMKKERDRGKLYESVCFLNQIGLTSLVLIPLNKALGIQLPLWVTCGWMAVIAGLAIAVMVLKNRG